MTTLQPDFVLEKRIHELISFDERVLQRYIELTECSLCNFLQAGERLTR